uniref:leucyl aminopeptidase n=1 Tax=mine drainage metagenome TaxID=410659 RepID=E6QPY1_9ZZZZ
MEYHIKNTPIEKQRAACIAVGIYESRQLSASAQHLDSISGGYLTKILATGDLEGKAGSTLMLHSVPNILGERVLLVGLGKSDELNGKAYLDIISGVMSALYAGGTASAALYLFDEIVSDCDINWKIEQAVRTAHAQRYLVGKLKSKHEPVGKHLKKLNLIVHTDTTQLAEAACRKALSIAEGVELAKDLGNLPGNVCTPTYLAKQAHKLAKAHDLKYEVLERKDMEKLGMGALLAVAKGSHEAPKFIVLQYNGGAHDSAPIVLVGKGITFDSGGISLKPGAEMDEMKYDMCGAASVLGTLQACISLKLPLNLVVLIPSCENMPDGLAVKPGDIVTSLSGQTIEILNTDAEGRLILCDALTYAERFKPALVIDVATLTGACVIALGHHASGLFSSHDTLAAELEQAGIAAQDRAWRMPLWDDYQSQLDSNFADIGNIGGRAGGSITAACFLSRFTKKYPWAHLDIAGTAWKSGKEKGGTGRPVPLLTHFLVARAATQP